MKTPEFAADNNVGRKTPEEIKKGLACLSITDFMKQYEAAKSIAYTCVSDVANDALAYIQQLEYEKLGNLRSIEKMAKYIKELEATNDVAHKLVCEGVIERNELKARLAQAERERDSAVADMLKNCETCKHSYMNNPDVSICPHVEYCSPSHDKWQWRGPCPENTKEADSDGKVESAPDP